MEYCNLIGQFEVLGLHDEVVETHNLGFMCLRGFTYLVHMQQNVLVQGTKVQSTLLLNMLSFDHVFQCVPNVVVVWHRNHFSLS